MNLKKTLGIVAVMFPCFVAVVDAQSRQSSGGSGSIGIIIGVIIGAIVVFLLCRELVCWYFKINRIVDLMEQQNTLLNSLLSKFASSSSVGDTISSNTGNRPTIISKFQKKCRKCHKEVAEDYTSCPYCGNRTFE